MTQLWGEDVTGEFRILGMRDKTGRRIRYIENRHCYADRRERDEALAMGRWTDAVKKWAKAGEEGPMPQIETYMILVGVQPENIQHIYAAEELEREMLMPIYLPKIRAGATTPSTDDVLRSMLRENH